MAMTKIECIFSDAGKGSFYSLAHPLGGYKDSASPADLEGLKMFNFAYFRIHLDIANPKGIVNNRKHQTNKCCFWTSTSHLIINFLLETSLLPLHRGFRLLSSNSKVKPSTRRSEKPRKGSDILGTMDC